MNDSSELTAFKKTVFVILGVVTLIAGMNILSVYLALKSHEGIRQEIIDIKKEVEILNTSSR